MADMTVFGFFVVFCALGLAAFAGVMYFGRRGGREGVLCGMLQPGIKTLNQRDVSWFFICFVIMIIAAFLCISAVFKLKRSTLIKSADNTAVTADSATATDKVKTDAVLSEQITQMRMTLTQIALNTFVQEVRDLACAARVLALNNGAPESPDAEMESGIIVDQKTGVVRVRPREALVMAFRVVGAACGEQDPTRWPDPKFLKQVVRGDNSALHEWRFENTDTPAETNVSEEHQ